MCTIFFHHSNCYLLDAAFILHQTAIIAPLLKCDFDATQPPYPLSFRKRIFFGFQHQASAKLCTACSELLEHTSNMKKLSPLFELLLGFFLSWTVLIPLFFLPTRKTPALFPFIVFSTHLSAGFLLHLLVLPHFLCVFVLRDKQRDIATSESIACMN